MLRLELSNLIISHLDLSLVVHFVREDHDLHVGSRVLIDLVQPDRDALEALTISQIEDDNDAVGSFVVSIGDGAVALLASRVPNLQLDRALIDLQRAEAEIDADRADVVLLEAIILQ